jgi:hypothetical protein
MQAYVGECILLGDLPGHGPKRARVLIAAYFEFASTEIRTMNNKEQKLERRIDECYITII